MLDRFRGCTPDTSAHMAEVVFFAARPLLHDEPRLCVGMPPMMSELGKWAQWAVRWEESAAERGPSGDPAPPLPTSTVLHGSAHALSLGSLQVGSSEAPVRADAPARPGPPNKATDPEPQRGGRLAIRCEAAGLPHGTTAENGKASGPLREATARAPHGVASWGRGKPWRPAVRRVESAEPGPWVSRTSSIIILVQRAPLRRRPAGPARDRPAAHAWLSPAVAA